MRLFDVRVDVAPNVAYHVVYPERMREPAAHRRVARLARGRDRVDARMTVRDRGRRAWYRAQIVTTSRPPRTPTFR
ncbi:hypothetical protein LFL97_12740 [Burkholderia sp. JSH-S8]|nr:hypothetical protein LFL97_12740 [Burkholderia sp. JSH-S8]